MKMDAWLELLQEQLEHKISHRAALQLSMCTKVLFLQSFRVRRVAKILPQLSRLGRKPQEPIILRVLFYLGLLESNRIIVLEWKVNTQADPDQFHL